MTAYTREDLIDSFLGSHSMNDPEPTEAQIDAYLELALRRFGKHPIELPTRDCDDLVYEIVKGRPFDPFED